MDEKFEKAVKDCIIPILSRFTNGLADLKVEAKTSFSGTKYYFVETNNIPMIPRVFKTLCIQGEGTIHKDEDGHEIIIWTLIWRWTYFNGGSNGAELIAITTNAEVLRDGRLGVRNIMIF